MSSTCQSHCEPAPAGNDPRYRRVLMIALIANLAMFLVEIGSGVRADSASLLADAIDFLGDAANYAVSLFVLGMGLQVRARAALLKALSMAAFGMGVLGLAGYRWMVGANPEPYTMGLVGTFALATNVGVAWMLYRWRAGDANMRSVWLCSRNDAIGNVLVIGAAVAVSLTASAWPDLVVAAFMAALALRSATAVGRQARDELAQEQAKVRVAEYQGPQ